MFYSCFVLSFDVCIVAITWSLLFMLLLYGLSVRLGRLLSLLVAQVVYRRWCVPCISSVDREAFGFSHRRGLQV
jgi:hypothetical protein